MYDIDDKKPTKKNRVVYFLIYLVYISLGVPDSIFGVAWPSIQQELKVPISYGSYIMATVTVLAAASSLLYAQYEKRTKIGSIVFICCMLIAIGLFGMSLSTSFILLCIFAIPQGLGAGAVDASVNNYVSRNFAPKHMLWLHGFWGVGAVVGPLMYSFVERRNRSWHYGAALVAGVQVIIMVILFIFKNHWTSSNILLDSNKQPDKSEIRNTYTNNKFSPWIRIAFTFLLSGFDITISLWLSTYMVLHLGMPVYIAGLAMSGYYAATTLGRFILGVLSQKTSIPKIINRGLLVTLLGCIIMLVSSNTLFFGIGIVILGFGLSPVYPFTLYEPNFIYDGQLGVKVTSYQISAALLGGLAVPMVIGFMMDKITIHIFGIAIFLLIFLILILRKMMLRKVQHHSLRH